MPSRERMFVFEKIIRLSTVVTECKDVSIRNRKSVSAVMTDSQESMGLGKRALGRRRSGEHIMTYWF